MFKNRVSADEYAWCVDSLKEAKENLELMLKDGDTEYASLQKTQVELLEEAVSVFEPDPESARSESDTYVLSPEFQKKFAALKTTKASYQGVIIDENNLT